MEPGGHLSMALAGRVRVRMDATEVARASRRESSLKSWEECTGVWARLVKQEPVMRCYIILELGVLTSRKASLFVRSGLSM